MKHETRPKPFVKWAGGKRNLIPEIFKRCPSKFNSYYEPFIGGGAVYFSLEEEIDYAMLSDNNFDLITTYQIIKNNPTALVKKLREHSVNHSEKYYYLIRRYKPKSYLNIAARFLYLNKTCYNGLYRVNNSGEFNVPIGDYKNPQIAQEENIFACHKAFKKAKISHSDFREIKPKQNDFVYLDPPYHPLSKSSFTKYTKEDFSKKDQIQLSQFIKALDKKGVYIMLSNSKTEFVEELYPKKFFRHKIVEVPRAVNCNGQERGKIKELLITNY